MKLHRARTILAATPLLAATLVVLAACANNNVASPQSAIRNPQSAIRNPPTITRVWPDYRTEDSFDRISEYFTGNENPGAQITLRTHPETRAGFYFFMRLREPDDVTIANAQVEISIITPDTPVKKTFLLRIPHELRKGTHLLNPGLTGPDWPWPDAKTQPVAWRVRLLDASGAVLASEQSYLWSQ